MLVDEYQDLNRAEQVLLDNVAEGHNLQVIGDEDQSVYSFKHCASRRRLRVRCEPPKHP